MIGGALWLLAEPSCEGAPPFEYIACFGRKAGMRLLWRCWIAARGFAWAELLARDRVAKVSQGVDFPR